MDLVNKSGCVTALDNRDYQTTPQAYGSIHPERYVLEIGKMPRAEIQEKPSAHNESWLAKTGSWLLIAGATLGTYQGLVLMSLGSVVLGMALWCFWKSR